VKKYVIVPLVAIFLLTSAVTLNAVFAQDEMGRIKVQLPSWVKTTASFWANNQSSDQEFLSALEFLIDNDIIKVPKIAQLEDKVIQLQKDNELLRTQIGKDGVTKPTMPPSNIEGVISFDLAKAIYSADDEFVFSGIESVGELKVFVVILDPSGNSQGMVIDDSSSFSGVFATSPRPVANYFDEVGSYTATAYTEGQTQADGITIELHFDGRFVSHAK